MLTINRLREFVAECVASIEEIRAGEVVITKDEVVKFMGKHSKEDNTLLLAIVPEHDLYLAEDKNSWTNEMGFYLLNKTDYSEHDHDSYISIFAKVQAVVAEFINKIKEEKEGGSFCDLFYRLEGKTISVSPIKGLSSCNGYFVGFNYESNY